MIDIFIIDKYNNPVKISSKSVIPNNYLAIKKESNMEKINLPMASKYTSPNPVTLICTQKGDGTTNLATVSWWTYLSYNPCMIAYAMAKTSYSGEMVRQNKKVVLTIPGEEIAKEVLNCGSTSGRNTDKVKEFGIKMQSLANCDIDIPLHSRVAIVCDLKEYVEVGDHYLYICNVKDVYGDKNEKALFAFNGYSQIKSIKE